MPVNFDVDYHVNYEVNYVAKKPKKVESDTVLQFPVSYNAFTCPRGHWVDSGKKGPTLTIANAIVALRYLLNNKNIELKYDNWRQHHITIPSFRNDPTKQWLNDIYEEHKLFFSFTIRGARQITVLRRDWQKQYSDAGGQ
jgi:hypothetical protein